MAAEASLDFHKLLEALRAGKVGPAYYVAGDEVRLTDQVLRALYDAVTGGNPHDIDCIVTTAAKQPLSQILDVCRTMPMLRPRRLTIVKEAQAFKADERRALIEYLSDPAPWSCLFMLGGRPPREKKDAEDDKATKKPAARKGKTAKPADLEGWKVVKQKLESLQGWVELPQFKYPRDLVPFILEALKTKGKTMESSAMQALTDHVGTDLSAAVDAAMADADLAALGVVIGFYPNLPENHIVLTVRTATAAEAAPKLREAGKQ